MRVASSFFSICRFTVTFRAASFTMAARPRVFVSCNDIPLTALHMLQEKCDVTLATSVYLTKQQVHDMVKGTDAILWWWYPCTTLDKDLLDAAGPTLKAVSIMATGYEHLDLKEMKKRSIKVGYTPHIQNAPVADMAVTLLLAVLHRLQESRSIMHVGNWDATQQSFLGYDICNSTVGIVGLGGIGLAIAKRIKAFEVARLLYCGPSEKSEANEVGAEYVSFDELLRQSDNIFISCRLNENTRYMFNDSAFNKMKLNSVLINIARGGIVDHEALVRALQEGKIWGAGLDVMTPEPLQPDNPLLKFHNCVVTPHVGGGTLKTREGMAVLAAKNILAALEGHPMPSPLPYM